MSRLPRSRGLVGLEGHVVAQLCELADESTGLPRPVDPVDEVVGSEIQMDKADHHATESWGSSYDGQMHRAHQSYLLKQGRLTEGLQMDIDNVKSMFPGKYDAAIDEMVTKLPNFIEAANKAGFNRPIV
nr:hypothetical protein OG781_36865 [Streptomyces sp. NBC_00830]